MNEDNLKQVAAVISAKKTKLTPEEAKVLGDLALVDDQQYRKPNI